MGGYAIFDMQDLVVPDNLMKTVQRLSNRSEKVLHVLLLPDNGTSPPSLYILFEGHKYAVFNDNGIIAWLLHQLPKTLFQTSTVRLSHNLTILKSKVLPHGAIYERF